MAHAFAPPAAEQVAVPWFVEVPESKLKYVVGPEGSTLKRLGTALRCPLEADRPRKKRQREVKFQGQTQFVEEDAADEQMVKIFMKGGSKQRLVAIDVIHSVADGDDPEDHAARAEGALVLQHELRHPDRLAWARWRLLSAAHEHGARAHLGLRGMRLFPKAAVGQLAGEAATRAQAAAEAVIAEAGELAELTVDAKDDLEPEDSVSDPALAPLVDQYGVIVRVADQDDNAVEQFMKVRVIGPPQPAQDAVALLRARFVDGKSTGSLLQAIGQVQAMPEAMARDFRCDVQTLEAECKVSVHFGQTILWVVSDIPEAVGSAKGMLRQMLEFYLADSCTLIRNLDAQSIESLFEDRDLGVLMSRPDCAVQIDDIERSVWICGRGCADVRRRIDEVVAQAPRGPAAGDEGMAAKRRRTSALSFHSESV